MSHVAVHMFDHIDCVDIVVNPLSLISSINMPDHHHHPPARRPKPRRLTVSVRTPPEGFRFRLRPGKPTQLVAIGPGSKSDPIVLDDEGSSTNPITLDTEASIGAGPDSNNGKNAELEHSELVHSLELEQEHRLEVTRTADEKGWFCPRLSVISLHPPLCTSSPADDTCSKIN